MAGALAAGLGAALTLYSVARSSWAYSADLGNPEFGVTFSCEYLRTLMLDEVTAWRRDHKSMDEREAGISFCEREFERMIAVQGFRHVRLSARWDEIELAPGSFDFRALDGLMVIAEREGVAVLLTVGMRAPRHPEFYIPAFYNAESRVPDGGDPSSDPELRAAGLRFVETVVAHYAGSEALEAWQADNEPFLATPRAHDWHLSESWVTEVVRLMKARDGQGRPVVVTDSSHLALDDDWRTALELGDILGQSVYPRRSIRRFGLFIPYSSLLSGPLAPNLPAQAKLARSRGKDLWLTELQAEPWDRTPTAELGRRKPKTMSPARLALHLEIGRRSGASRVYLWGAEWWHALAASHGDSSYEALAREAFRATDAPASAGGPR